MSGFGDQAMQVIRETLEGMVEASMATEAIFVALEREGRSGLPGSPETVLTFIEGPLHESLRERFGPAEAQQFTERLSSILRPLLAEKPSEPTGRRRERRSAVPTAQMGTSDGPVRLLVVAGTPSLVLALRGALGPGRIAAVVGRDLSTVQQLLRELEPQVLIIDGSDSAGLDSGDLATVLKRAIESGLVVIWGVEHPWGREVLEALRSGGVECAPLDRREGVQPLLDYLRSRAA